MNSKWKEFTKPRYDKIYQDGVEHANNIEAIEYIEEYQRGKSGIYPVRLAETVSAQFQIPLEKSTELVLNYIRENCGKTEEV